MLMKVGIASDLKIKAVLLLYVAEDLERGLMFVTDLGDLDGMLFDFKVSDRHSVWMKNTFLPLDVLFVADSGLVVDVLCDLIPFSTKTHQSCCNCRYMLEVPAGTVRSLGVSRGDYVFEFIV
jgi:uncharacterized membrane protein (UPF0127 family)